MSRLTWVIAAYALTTAACSKNLNNADCIERIFTPVTAHSVNSSDVATIDKLFKNNGIDNRNFRYYRYTHDAFQTLYPPYAVYDQKLVRLDQYTNGVRIFSSTLSYVFFNNTFNAMGGHLTNGTSLDTSPALEVSQIRNLFLDHIEQFDHSGDKYKNKCFEAEFGYYNLKAGISNSQEVLAKAWKVKPKKDDYPFAYYEDKDGRLISYDNGVRTFR